MTAEPGSPVTRAAVVSTILQLVMVVSGHFIPAIAGLFPIVGTGIGGVAGFLAGRWATTGTTGQSAGAGLVAGASGALIGTIVSCLLGDVPASVIAIGTGASGGAGALGGVVARLIGRRPSA